MTKVNESTSKSKFEHFLCSSKYSGSAGVQPDEPRKVRPEQKKGVAGIAGLPFFTTANNPSPKPGNQEAGSKKTRSLSHAAFNLTPWKHN